MDSRIQVRMINWTLVLVVGLGLLIGALILEPPPTPTTKSKNVGTQKSNDRAPASTAPTLHFPILGALKAHRPVANPDAVEVEIKCGGSQVMELEENVQQIRLNGSLCEKKQKATRKGTEVLNSANGIFATVFFKSESDFSTDYVPLKEGENIVVVTHSYDDGTSETNRYTVTRNPAAVENN